MMRTIAIFAATLSLTTSCTEAPTSNNATTVPECPTQWPAPSGSCSTPGLTCEYGDDVRRGCRSIATCESDGWRIASPDCQVLDTTDCPGTVTDAQGSMCPMQDKQCAIADNLCTCTNCISGPVDVCEGDPVWQCQGPEMAQEGGCPSPKPLVGGPCATIDQVCTYGCGPDGGRVCTGNLWATNDGGPCPVSTRTAKRNIRHLGLEDVEALRRQALDVRLTTYEYRDPAEHGHGPKLGFIIEEMPEGSPAVQPSRTHVDLYGYTSMLLGTIQAQQRQIEALERRLKVLESEKR